MTLNEQIPALADRLWRIHPLDIDAMGLKTRTEFYEHELKKFVEVIVRECVAQNKVAIQSLKDRPEDIPGWGVVLDLVQVTCKLQIETHFEVDL